jgi:hypothetical protein
MNLEDSTDLIDLCEQIIDDLKRFDSGTSYENLQIATKFGILVAPLLSGSELVPELRQSVPATKLALLQRSVSIIKNAQTFSLGAAQGQYGRDIFNIKASIEEYKRKKTATGIKKNGPWTVFYSWQSSLSNSTNRGIVRNCLEKAAAALNAEMSVEDSLREDSVRVDSDINGRPGSPKIFDTILEKIKLCDVFVADVSLVGNKQSNSLSRQGRFFECSRISARPSIESVG